MSRLISQPQIKTPTERKRSPRARETLNEVLSRQRPLVRRVATAAFIIRLAPVLLPVVLKFTLSPILHHRPARLFGRIWSPEDLLLGVVLAGVGVALIRGLANYRFVSLAGRCGHALVADLRKVMFEHILRMPVSYVDRRGTGKILLRFIGDSDALRNWHSRTRPTVLADSALVVVLAAGMFWLQWKLALWVLLPMPLLVWMIRRLSRRLQELTLRSRQLQAEFTGHVQSRFDKIRQSKWFDTDRKTRRSTVELVDAIARQNILRERYAATVRSVGNLLAFLTIPILIWFGISLVWNGQLATGSFVALVWLAAHLSVATQRLSAAIVIRQKGLVSLQRITRLLERSAERGRSSTRKKFRPVGRSIQCVDLVFRKRGLGAAETPLNVEWGGQRDQPLAADLDVGEFCDVLLGFRRPDRGKIFLDGQSLDEVRIPGVRSSIGWIPQSPAMFDDTVAENIQIARPNATADELEKLVRSTGLIADNDVAEWLSRPVGPGGTKLSPREILAVAVLRVLLRRPCFVLIDHAEHALARTVLRHATDYDPLILFAPSADRSKKTPSKTAESTDDLLAGSNWGKHHSSGRPVLTGHLGWS